MNMICRNTCRWTSSKNHWRWHDSKQNFISYFGGLNIKTTHTRPECILLHSQYISSIMEVNFPNSGMTNWFCNAFFTKTNSSVAHLKHSESDNSHRCTYGVQKAGVLHQLRCVGGINRNSVTITWHTLDWCSLMLIHRRRHMCWPTQNKNVCNL